MDLDVEAGGRDTIVCAGGDGKNVCKFDSGGPLFDKENRGLIGIALWVIKDEGGNFCDRAPAVFTRVASYIPWINENLGGSGGYPYPDFEWIRNATNEIGRHCNRIFNDAGACMAAKPGCMTELKPGASTQELLECVNRGQVCADQEDPSKYGQCVENAKACVKENDLPVWEIDMLEECAKKGL